MTGRPRLIGQERSVLWSGEWLSELGFCFVLSTLLVSSYHFSSFPVISFPVEYKKSPHAAAARGATLAATASREERGGGNGYV